MGYRKGEFRTGGMRNRRYTEQKECRTDGMQDRRNVGLDGCMTGGMQCRKGGMQEKEGCRTGEILY